MTTDAAELQPPASRRWLMIDLASSYALSVARVASMGAIVAIFYRFTDPVFTAAFVLSRTMFGLFTYVFAGLNPATQHAMRRVNRPAMTATPTEFDTEAGPALSYRDVVPVACRSLGHSPAAVYTSSIAVVLLLGVISLLVLLCYASNFARWHSIDWMHESAIATFLVIFGIGTLLRLAAEPASAVLQTRGWLALDNSLLILAEIAWPILAWNYASQRHTGELTVTQIAQSFAFVNGLVTLLRLVCARVAIGAPTPDQFAFSPSTFFAVDHRLAYGIAVGGLVTSVGSFADFLYAPANLVLIGASLGAAAVAEYTPALQFDGALLLLVGAIAATMLPRAMRLAGENRVRELRTLYLRSTLVSLAILAIAAIATWIAAPTVLRLWLGQPMPATLAVLPFVLLHTVIGGTAGVGRATLLAMGRFRAYTVSAIVGGVANVALALLFVVGLGWGLRGVALATVVAVFGRCALWMPWYILRALRDDRLIELIKPTAVRSDPNVGQVP